MVPTFLSRVYDSRVNVREHSLDLPSPLLLSAFSQVITELHLVESNSAAEAGGANYLMIIFQVALRQLSTQQWLDTSDPERLLEGALQNALQCGLTNSDIEAILLLNETTHALP